VKAQIDLLGPDQTLLEKSKTFDVHFPEPDRKADTPVAQIWIEPQPSDVRTMATTVQYASARLLV
jgi:hypothetical protein